MKFLVLLIPLVALSRGAPKPVIPGDNSHYVEGESRYIWMPDGEDVPHLVDLEEPIDEKLLNSRDGANNQYWLYTRRNPTNSQIITHNNANSVRNSNYNGNRHLKVIVHGWNSDGNSKINPLVTAAVLAYQDCNVIVVDWRRLSNSSYNTAANGVRGIGEAIGTFLNWLIATGGGSWDNIHLIGFSLGAHVVGNVRRTAGIRPRRITGLDPAGPRFGENSDALNRNGARYVETIHTDGGLLGIFDPIAHCDFYPNGGRNRQPGCWTSLCSHSRAYELFASTVRTNHLVARRCNNINDAQNNRCTGASLSMGNAIMHKTGTNGLYGLTTRAEFPF